MNFANEQLAIKPNFCTLPKTGSHILSNHFLYVGRLSKEKGIDLLLKTFARSSYKIKIAGDGPLRSEVMDFSLKYSNIEFVGSVKKEDVYKLMSTSSALIFPSIWYEGMPLTIIEAFACGLPVITSELGAMENMITPYHDGLHFEAGNGKALQQKLDEWESFTSEEKNVYRANARKTYKQNYTPEKNFEQLMAIYNSVIRSKGSEVSIVAALELKEQL